jgi:hypothetical protein
MKKMRLLFLIITLIIGLVPLVSCTEKPRADMPYGKVVDMYIQGGEDPLYKNEKNIRVKEEEVKQLTSTEGIYKRVPLVVEATNRGADGMVTVHAVCNLDTLHFNQDSQNQFVKRGEATLFKFVFWVSLNEWTPYYNADEGVNAFTVQAVNIADLPD